MRQRHVLSALRELVPSLANNPNAPGVAIMQHAADYIEELKKKLDIAVAQLATSAVTEPASQVNVG